MRISVREISITVDEGGLDLRISPKEASIAAVYRACCFSPTPLCHDCIPLKSSWVDHPNSVTHTGVSDSPRSSRKDTNDSMSQPLSGSSAHFSGLKSPMAG